MRTLHLVYSVSGSTRRFIASFDTDIQADNFMKKSKTGLALCRYIQYIDEYEMVVHEQRG